MAKVGKLNVEVGASTKELRRDLGGAKRTIGKFKRDLDTLGDTSPLRSFDGSITRVAGGAGRLIGGVTKALGALGVAGVAAGAGLGMVAASQIELIGDQADAAKKLGITRNELITLQRAATGVGVDSDKLTSSFEKMSDVLGSAFRGDSGAVKTLEKLGLSVSNLRKMDPTGQFMAIGRAVDSIDDPAMKIAAARDIFGKAGGDLIPMFEGGAGAIAGAYRELEKVGNLLSGLNQSAIEKAGDSMDRVKTMAEGAKTQLAAISAPLLTKIVEDTDNWVTSMGGVEAIATGGLKDLAAAFQTVGDKASYAASWAGVMKEGAGMIGGAVEKAAPIAKAVIPGVAGLGLLSKGAGALYDYGQEYVEGVNNRGEKLDPKGKGGRKGYAPKEPGLGTMVGDYVRTANENAEDDYMGVRQRSEQAVEPAGAQAYADWKRGRERDPNLPKYLDKMPSGAAGYEAKRINDDPYMDKWQSKIPGNRRDYETKGPAMAMAVGANPMTRDGGGGGNIEIQLSEQTNLLREVRDSLRDGVQGRYS